MHLSSKLLVAASTSQAPPYISQTSGIVERAIRHVREATRAVLAQAGLPVKFWPWASVYFSNARNFTLKFGGVVPYESAFNTPCAARLIPFGAAVEALLHGPERHAAGKFAPASTPCMFVGWATDSGMKWAGDYLVVPLSEPGSALPSGDAGTDVCPGSGPNSGRLHTRRTKEITVPEGEWVFPFKAAFVQNRCKLQSPEAVQSSPDPFSVEGGVVAEGLGGHNAF